MLLKRCSEIVDLYTAARADEHKVAEFMSATYGMAMIGMITGFNFANHDQNGDYGLEVYRTDPHFLFQYLMNECQSDMDKMIGIVMFQYIREQIKLGNIYEW
ncbi:hypothetical protein OAV49_00780 [Alphaproteobacteria bacterium]|jgi:hypothetical protein|nr:hypothetical protein [Alphaproteobacteria bacterium]